MYNIKNFETFKSQIELALYEQGIFNPKKTTPKNLYFAISYVLKKYLKILSNKTQNNIYSNNIRHTYYLTMEFMFEPLLHKYLFDLNLLDHAKEIAKQYNTDLETIENFDEETKLGNGGLGRLSSCFIESAASLNYPMFAYSLLHKYGLFKQHIQQGQQVETAEDWLYKKEYPFLSYNPTSNYEVLFGGTCDENLIWIYDYAVKANSHTLNISGYHTDTVLNAKLWQARPIFEDEVNYHDYLKGHLKSAFSSQLKARELTSFLYPSIDTQGTKELKLKQEYFFTSASIQDILNRNQITKENLSEISHRLSIQLNDTHPALAIPEFIRILIHDYNQDFKKAFDTACQVFNFTNHTLVIDGLEKWSKTLMQQTLPLHYQIIERIDKINNFSSSKIIEQNNINMGHLSVIGSNKVNGVSKLHSHLLKDSAFKELSDIYKEKFTNVTNGTNHRYWLKSINPDLSLLIENKIGPSFIDDLSKIQSFEKHINDTNVLNELQTIKQSNKEKLFKKFKIDFTHNCFVDTFIKRIHEYKRQLLKLFQIIHYYHELKQNKITNPIPKLFLFSGKAYPTYEEAKTIIHLINLTAEKINSDPSCAGSIHIAFIPNYNVDKASFIIPATDLSEQISCPGLEASGTGNMKFALNGALTYATHDGANIEIKEAVGKENIFTFGHTAEEITKLKEKKFSFKELLQTAPELDYVLKELQIYPQYTEFFEKLITTDKYFMLRDFKNYCKGYRQIDAKYKDQNSWQKSCIKNIANIGYFSSDRAIKEYSQNIWKLKPMK
jgi:starch phosphorylase